MIKADKMRAALVEIRNRQYELVSKAELRAGGIGFKVGKIAGSYKANNQLEFYNDMYDIVQEVFDKYGL